ncbi:polyribonucleotide nucleotidyltransferase [Tanacetum coccineum]
MVSLPHRKRPVLVAWGLVLGEGLVGIRKDARDEFENDDFIPDDLHDNDEDGPHIDNGKQKKRSKNRSTKNVVLDDDDCELIEESNLAFRRPTSESCKRLKKARPDMLALQRQTNKSSRAIEKLKQLSGSRKVNTQKESKDEFENDDFIPDDLHDNEEDGPHIDDGKQKKRSKNRSTKNVVLDDDDCELIEESNLAFRRPMHKRN